MLRLLLVTTLLFAAGDAFAKAEGVDSRATYQPVGCGSADGGAAGECHVQPLNPELMVTIDGPTELGTNPEDAGFYTVSIPPQSEPLLGAGMNVSIGKPNMTGCELEPFAPVGKIDYRNESLDPNDPVLSHEYQGDAPPSTLIGVWSYQFLLVNCSTPGPLLLHAAMNAFDGSGDEEGEIWNLTELAVTVTAPEPSDGLLGAAAIGALASMRRYQRRRPARDTGSDHHHAARLRGPRLLR
jgi:MYXO-CTERM domain-containing protein